MMLRKIFSLFTTVTLLILSFLVSSCDSSNLSTNSTNSGLSDDPSSPLNIQLFMASPPQLNIPTEISCTVSSDWDLPDSNAKILLPDGVSLMDGTVAWHGDLKASDPVKFKAKIVFKQTGEWKIEGQVSHSINKDEYYSNLDFIYGDISTDNSEFGWSTDSEVISEHNNDSSSPLNIQLFMANPPQLNIPTEILCTVYSDWDLPNSSAKIVLPNGASLIDGTLAWHGDLKAGIPIKFSAELVFKQTGKLKIEGQVAHLIDKDESYNSLDFIFVYIDSEKSLFQWPSDDQVSITQIKKGENVRTSKSSILEPDIRTLPKPPAVSMDDTIRDLPEHHSITVTGNYSYWTQYGDNRSNPNVQESAKHFLVELVNNSGTHLAYGYTNDTGNYSIPGIDPSGGIKVRMWCYRHCDSTDDAELRVINTGDSLTGLTNVYHTAFTDTYYFNDDGKTHDIGWWGVTANASGDGAYWIFNDLYRSYEYLHTQDPSIELGSVTVKWSETSTDGNHRDPTTHQIHLLSTAERFPDVVVHEYGHVIMYNIYGYIPSFSYGPDGKHFINAAYDEGCGWVEGWADFLPLVMNDNPYYTNDGGNVNLENKNWSSTNWTDGAAVEGRVAGALWDIYDSSNDGYGGFMYDQCTEGFDEIWDNFTTQSSDNFEEFWDTLKWEWTSGQQYLLARAIFQNTIIFDEVRMYLTSSCLPSIGGSITEYQDLINYPYNQSVQLTAIPNTGYHFLYWNWDDTNTDNPYQINMNFDHSEYACFAINTYTLTYSAGSHGTISGTSPQTVNYGDSGTAVTAVPDTGYHFVNWSDSSTSNPRTDTNVSSNINVTANFAVNTYTLTYTAGSHGTISGTSPQTVNYGDSGTAVTAVPDTGYHFVNWSDSSTSNPRTDTNVSSDISVTANFEHDTCYLDPDSTAGGSVTTPGEAGPYPYSYGTPVSIIASPAANYHFTYWSGDTGTITNPYAASTTITMNGNYDITANFAINTYTLTYTAGSHGSISGTSPQTVNYGGSGSAVTAVPDTGYHFVNWSDSSTSNPRTDTNVSSNINVIANFAIDTYDINARVSGGNGTVDPSHQEVDHGESANITFYPDAGYHISSIMDNGQPQPYSNPYILTDVVTDHTVIVTYSNILDLGSLMYEITLDSTYIDSDLTHFPVLLHLSDSGGQGSQDLTDVFDAVGNNYKKIAVTAADKSTQLYVEVESWNATSEEAWLWVSSENWTLNSSENTTIYLYCDTYLPDNEEYVGLPGSEAAEQVWNTTFTSIYHNEETSGTIYDSTQNNLDGTQSGGITYAAPGIAGSALSFDGSDDYVEVGNTGLSGNWTIEFWAKLASIQPVVQYPIGFSTGYASPPPYGTGVWMAYSGSNYNWGMYDGTNVVNGSQNSVDTWYYLAVSKSGDTYILYMNGQPDSSGSLTDVDISNLQIGRRIDNSSGVWYFNGTIDEVRVSETPRSSAWIKATKYTCWDDMASYERLLTAKTSLIEEKASDSVIVVPVNIDMVKDSITKEYLTNTEIDSYSANISYFYYPPDGIEMVNVRAGDAPFNTLTDNTTWNGSSASWIYLSEDTANGTTPGITVARLVPRLIGCAFDTYNLTLMFPSILSSDNETIYQESPVSVTYQRGDANGDGLINGTDYLYTARFYLNMLSIDQVHALNAASPSHDGPAGDVVGMDDAYLIACLSVDNCDCYYQFGEEKSGASYAAITGDSLTVETSLTETDKDGYMVIPVTVKGLPKDSAGLGAYALSISYDSKTIDIIDVLPGKETFTDKPVFNNLKENGELLIAGIYPNVGTATGDVIVGYLVVKTDDAKFSSSNLKIKVMELVDGMGNTIKLKTGTSKEQASLESIEK